MPPTDTSEKGLESLIVRHLTQEQGYLLGDPNDFNREVDLDWPNLLAFLQATQPNAVNQLGIAPEGIKRTKFLHRLQNEITKRGLIDVLRKGFSHESARLILFYGTPSRGNPKAAALHQANQFSVTRQVRYSRDESQRSLDLVVFINGLPVITFELKNSLTKQTYTDAIQQYQRDRDPQELIFQPGRCAVHLAVDDTQVWMCTKLTGKDSWFLPFNKGYNDGAGNPPNPNGLMTDYLWREILSKESLTNILENYAQRVEEKDEKGRIHYKYIFPRYHQLDVTRRLLADAMANGTGKRYLIQHSAGSGKSNSIAWLAHQLVGLEKDEQCLFQSIIVVTDRTNLDTQIKNTIKDFNQVSSIVGHAKDSNDLRQFIEQCKRIIISTVQKFPFILKELGNSHRGQNFAILIDEAHSSQGGRTAAKLNQSLAASPQAETDEEESIEDQINRLMEGRKMLTNASYFAFTATPKNKTLEIFGEPYPQGDVVKHRPFHTYTMKQAIQEGFIVDVLRNYTPVQSWYNLTKTVEDDPQFDAKRAKKKLNKYVQSHDHPIREKAELMIDHFHDQVIAKRFIGGQARAMVVTSGIQRAIQYYLAFQAYLQERKSPFKAIVAFSGEQEHNGQKVTEATFNGFPSNQIEKTFKADPYRFLIVADKFQTGYDEPLLHTMYVDKTLSGIKAVQTLSRLNRAHPKKSNAFVLDFCNDTETIVKAFSDYYRTTILSEETDPNKLHDLQADLEAHQVFTWQQVDELVQRFLKGEPRETAIDPILDHCVVVYQETLDEDGQVDFKSKAKTFVRAYNFLASLLPYSNPQWEKLSIFFNFLVDKLPSPVEEDLSKGILQSIDMDSYRVEVKAAMAINLPDVDSEIGPVPTSTATCKPEPELDYLSNIVKSFNEQFGNVDWQNKDKIRQVIIEELPRMVAADKAFQNAKQNSDKQNARLEHDRALQSAVVRLLSDHTELYKQFSDNTSFKKWLGDTVFELTYCA